MPGSTPARMSTDARRDQLLRTGVELFDQRGPDEVSIEEIARAAGVSNGLLYHYFPTKKDFVLAALSLGREQLGERLAVDPSTAPPEQFERSLDAFLDNVEEHASAYTAIFRRGGGGDPQISAELDAGREAFLEMMLDGVRRWDGAPVSTERTPQLEAALQGWLFFVEGVVLRWLEHGGFDRSQLRGLLREGLLGALQAGAGAGSASRNADAVSE
jgi:AcrR family transcriptional regulator